MKRTAAIILWATSAAIISTISVGTAIALDTDCHAAYNKFWKKIHEPRKLDHKPSKETIRKWTAYNEAMLRKLDIACEVMISGNSMDDFDLSHYGSLVPLHHAQPEMVDFIDSSSASDQGDAVGSGEMIPEKEYPVYDVYAGTLGNSSSIPSAYFPGWYAGGGYLPSRGPESVPLPTLPIAPTPEPLPFSLVMIGAAFIVVRGRK